MLKVEKKEYLNKLSKSMKDKELILVDYKGITVKNISDIREKLKKSNSMITVIKNSLIKRFFEKQGIEMEASLLKGMSALITVGGAFYDASKIISDADKDELLKIKGGYFEGKVIDEYYVKKLANIPSKEILYSMLVGCLQSPIANLVYALESIAKKKATEEPLIEPSLGKVQSEGKKLNNESKDSIEEKSLNETSTESIEKNQSSTENKKVEEN